MIITLLGMSGVGKTYWSKQLEDLGWQRICCDDLIGKQLGIAGIGNVADWMGQPYTEGYNERQQRYLDIERSVMESILSEIKSTPEKKLVIDTTGGVIYTGDDICQRLQISTTTVYIKLDQSHYAAMLQRYLADPKPVVWGQHYHEPISVSYPELLEYRAAQYARYATVTLPYTVTSQPSFSVNDFLDAILQHQ